MVQMRLQKPDLPEHNGMLGWLGDAAKLPQLLRASAAEYQPAKAAAQFRTIEDYSWQDSWGHVMLRIQAPHFLEGAGVSWSLNIELWHTSNKNVI